MATPGPSEGSIVLDIEVVASVEDVWAAWVEPAPLARWLAKRARVEPHVGGPYELFWDLEHPEVNSTLGCTVTAVNEEYLLEFHWRGPDEFAALMNATPFPTSVAVRFQPLGPNRTRIRLVHSGFGPGDEWAKARASQEASWKAALSRLQTLLGPPPPARA
ncbi:MAG: SRPBCC domain-containing protein [Thermoplasmata archaeon]|nr:SRPBCC domain-containing protein [Thermoplasmata archaeon]